MTLAPKFKQGDPVQVCARDVAHHRRTPSYVQGRRGYIERFCGAFANPELLAQGRDGLPLINLYRVRFEQAELWTTAEADAGDDSVDVEIYEHWLRQCDEPF